MASLTPSEDQAIRQLLTLFCNVSTAPGSSNITYTFNSATDYNSFISLMQNRTSEIYPGKPILPETRNANTASFTLVTDKEKTIFNDFILKLNATAGAVNVAISDKKMSNEEFLTSQIIRARSSQGEYVAPKPSKTPGGSPTMATYKFATTEDAQRFLNILKNKGIVSNPNKKLINPLEVALGSGEEPKLNNFFKDQTGTDIHSIKENRNLGPKIILAPPPSSLQPNAIKPPVTYGFNAARNALSGRETKEFNLLTHSKTIEENGNHYLLFDSAADAEKGVKALADLGTARHKKIEPTADGHFRFAIDNKEIQELLFVEAINKPVTPAARYR